MSDFRIVDKRHPSPRVMPEPHVPVVYCRCQHACELKRGHESPHRQVFEW